MTKNIATIILLLLLEHSNAYGSDMQDGHAIKIALTSGKIAVVTEGKGEPRSVGSYSLRIYSATNPAFPYDDFIVGIVRPRDGFVERVAVHDIDEDGTAEIIVIIRNVGTGSYLSADAIQYRDKSLRLLGSVGGLEKDENPILALKKAYREAPNKSL